MPRVANDVVIDIVADVAVDAALCVAVDDVDVGVKKFGAGRHPLSRAYLLVRPEFIRLSQFKSTLTHSVSPCKQPYRVPPSLRF